MELKTRGKALNIDIPIIGKITRDKLCTGKDHILISEDLTSDLKGFKCIISTADFFSGIEGFPYIEKAAFLHHLSDGDIVVINTDGVINTLYRVNSLQNAILVTERCNSNCLMCSQPPKDREDIPYLHNIHQQLLPLIPKDCADLGITGGEPTLMGNLFFDLLHRIKTELPDTEVHCLTNGRTFAWKTFAKKLGLMKMDRLVLGIPLYSDYAPQHDYIVQAEGAFEQTMLGLYHLAAEDVRIEIRIVLHNLTIPRLGKLARFIYKNLPFVEHIAFMGLEYQGYTPHNIEKLWIDPVNYMAELEDAVTFLSSKDMNVSIYNSQLCLMPEQLWSYSRNSISDWKNIYLPECTACRVLDKCGGLFKSAEKKHSSFIQSL
ncbi:His-Xaa-Ser system radical SAM maturase HxsC [Pedobacter antarcticus]|uniref:His-Xaa-Ser system radical SAM maturase HxsC n=1 Tax=Pedobacter antarcticus TaxID=34086 RepID=UPI000891F42E|nr:His-Xaa-Ser system radical SAM maturase HxsC [Pedobacter antarcticus]SDM53131.1 His-Xaa-Ser system radical SAM maturase HxsC [Pedobacter antarcticus]